MSVIGLKIVVLISIGQTFSFDKKPMYVKDRKLSQGTEILWSVSDR